ncbi:FAP100, partial [Symbiodinium sp. KB8]
AKRAEIEAEEAARKEQCRRTGKMYRPPDIEAVLDDIFVGWPEPAITDEAFATESSGEDLPMYFTQPQQLLQLFADKEERNLFLITNKQEIEHQLEELRQEYRDTQAAMERQTRALEESKARLQERIAAEEEKMAALSDGLKGGGEGDESQVLLRIADVYELCGGDLTSKPGPISMLTRLEGNLETLLAKMSGLPPEYVKEKEKAMEDERRKVLRVEKAAADAADVQRRLENSIRRSQEPVKRRTGKPLMERSRPVRKRKQEERVDPDKLRELADMKYFV